jgi:hypothetical protein
MLVRVIAVLILVLALPARPAAAQDSLRVLADTGRVQVLRLSDGSVLVGRVTQLRADSVAIRTAAGEVTVARAAVRSVRERPASSMRGGEYWPEDPNATRYLFAPSAQMLRRGEGYFCNVWLFLLCLTGGLSDRVTLGGGMSIVPGIDIADNVFYLTPKVGLYAGEHVQVALGAFAGWSGAVTDDATSFGIVYGVSTFGSADANVSAGLGYAYWNDDLAENPLLMLGGKWRLTRGTALISENYVLPRNEGGIGSLGIRFFNDRIAGDVALLRFFDRAGSDDNVVIPFVGLAVRFR